MKIPIGQFGDRGMASKGISSYPLDKYGKLKNAVSDISISLFCKEKLNQVDWTSGKVAFYCFKLATDTANSS